jgi:hypothetical protein
MAAEVQALQPCESRENAAQGITVMQICALRTGHGTATVQKLASMQQEESLKGSGMSVQGMRVQ